MTHTTTPGSKRDAILYALDNLTPTELSNAGTSSDLLYKIANPNQSLNLDVEIAARLDACLVARGKCAIFQNLMHRTFESCLANHTPKAIEIESELRHLTTDLGDLSAAVDRALADKIWTPAEGREVGLLAGGLGRKAFALRDSANRIGQGPQLVKEAG